MRSPGAGLILVLAGCVSSPRPVPVVVKPVEIVAKPAVDSQAELRAVLQAFVTAAETKRFSDVHALLAKPLRDRYSVDQLSVDFLAEPLASARLAQIKLKSEAPFAESKASASLEWASGRAVRLVREPDGWRVAALE